MKSINRKGLTFYELTVLRHHSLIKPNHQADLLVERGLLIKIECYQITDAGSKLLKTYEND